MRLCIITHLFVVSGCSEMKVQCLWLRGWEFKSQKENIAEIEFGGDANCSLVYTRVHRHPRSVSAALINRGDTNAIHPTQLWCPGLSGTDGCGMVRIRTCSLLILVWTKPGIIKLLYLTNSFITSSNNIKSVYSRVYCHCLGQQLVLFWAVSP